MAFEAIALTIVVTVIIIIFISPAMLSSQISQEEREQYHNLHGEWPNW